MARPPQRNAVKCMVRITPAMDTVRGGMPEQGTCNHEVFVVMADRNITGGFRIAFKGATAGAAVAAQSR